MDSSGHKPTDQSPVSTITLSYTLFIVIITLMLTLLACACTSTSVDDPSETPASSEGDITLTLSGSDSYALPLSRATGSHDAHQLRYVASLYSTATGSIGIEAASQGGEAKNLVERIEQTAASGNTITFRGVPPGYYFVVVFADYIDADAPQNADGSYPDKYYDTHTNPDFIALKAADSDLFNNHNLDCFLYYPEDSFEKKAGQPLALSFNMKRCVSRVEIVASNAGSSALRSITVKSYSVASQLVVTSGVGRTVISAKNKDISLPAAPAGEGAGILFFYYTFNTSYGMPLKATDFTLNPNEAYEFANDGSYSVPADRITPEANIIYKVTGNFLSTTATPSKAVDINVTTHTDWSDSSLDIPAN